MTTDALHIGWKPPGPVSAAFMASIMPVPLLCGPVGSGKTTTVIEKLLILAALQRVAARTNGAGKQTPETITILSARTNRQERMPVRKFKVVAIRNTYRELWGTTIKSWWKRVPKEAGEWTGADGAPATHRIAFELPDGTAVDFIIEFLAIGDNSVEDALRGREATFFWLNEFDLISWEVFNHAPSRIGRYPGMDEGGPTHFGILGDLNAPEFESEAYKNIFTKSPAELAVMGIELFIQPGGREPNAENIPNLPPGYYDRSVASALADPRQGQGYVDRMIDNKPGYSRAGKPVHPAYVPTRHSPAQAVKIDPRLPILIGLDPRTHPSAAFMQRNSLGQRRFVGELQGEQNMGPRRFARLVAEKLHDMFPNPEQRLPVVRGIVDPSAAYGADKEAGDQDWIEIFSAESGIRVDAAGTNSATIRREALRGPLMKSIDDGAPAILICRWACPILCAALASGFRFRKLNTPGADKWGDEPEKNNYADMAEAAEYACMDDGADAEIRSRYDDEQRRFNQQQDRPREDHDWNPLEMGR